MRKTRIVATLGPASVDTEVLRDLVYAGVDVFRLNYSHGTHESHRAACEAIRDICGELGHPVAVMQDLSGPKIRCGEIEGDKTELAEGMETVITTSPLKGTNVKFSCTYKSLPKDASKGDRVLLDDGMIELEVLSASGDEVRCRVVRGGTLSSHKGINLPGMDLSTPSVTPKDMKDLAASLDMGVDFVALSFVRTADDIMKVKRAIDKHECSPLIIAKIEKPEAVQNIDEILECADGIMVARGDLGVELPAEQVPAIQKMLIYKANAACKIVITATQMLESMIHSSVPTRAEVADVTVAITEGTDAVMLSAESATGHYPVEAVKAMHRIAIEAEKNLEHDHWAWDWERTKTFHPLGDAIADAATELCSYINAKAIITFSTTGELPCFLSKNRPFAPILVFSTTREQARKMRLYWGVEAVVNSTIHCLNDLQYYAAEFIRENALAKGTDPLITISSSPFGVIEHSNAIEVTQLAGEFLRPCKA